VYGVGAVPLTIVLLLFVFTPNVVLTPFARMPILVSYLPLIYLLARIKTNIAIVALGLLAANAIEARILWLIADDLAAPSFEATDLFSAVNVSTLTILCLALRQRLARENAR
jgi:hypothetical protein